MEYRKLGRSGLKVSTIGLGTNAFGKRADKATSIRIIHEAMFAGVNFIDTANIYSDSESERIIGEALVGKRHEVVLATKVGLVRNQRDPNGKGSSRYHIRQEIEGSLERLKTDYIDLYQIHTFDPETPLEETLGTLDDLVHEGKVRYVGASNYAAWELMKALGISDKLGLARYISVQPCYSLADRTPERELVPVCLDQGVGLIPYFPLAGGILTGKYASNGQLPVGSRADKDPGFAKRLESDYVALGEKVSAVANKIGCTPAALSLAWLLRQPAVSTIIVGATRIEQVQGNLQSVSLQVQPEVLEELNQLSEPFCFGKPFGYYRLS